MSTTDLDDAAHRLRDLAVDLATSHYARPLEEGFAIAIEVTAADAPGAVAPPGYRAPAGGILAVRFAAHSEAQPEIAAESVVTVWPTEVPGSGDLLMTCADTGRRLHTAVLELTPEPREWLCTRLDDFVGVQLGTLVATLNAHLKS